MMTRRLSAVATGFLLSLAVTPHPILCRGDTTEPNSEAIHVEADELDSGLNFANRKWLKNASLPKRVRELHGRRVRIRGYMYPTWEEHGITSFILNGETRTRGFDMKTETAPPVQYVIEVRLKPGQTSSYLQRPIAVEGRFIIGEELKDGVLYRIEDATVTPVQPRKGYHNSAQFGC